jgi:hypothetical protein
MKILGPKSRKEEYDITDIVEELLATSLPSPLALSTLLQLGVRFADRA